MGWKNKSDKFKFGLLGLPDGSIYIGDKKAGTYEGISLVNFAQSGDIGYMNGTLTFGANATIKKEDFNNDRFFWECLDPLLQPPDVCFKINMLGGGVMDMDSKSGGSMEGTYFGRARWKRFVQDGVTHTGIVVGTCETDYKKSGKAAWVTWIYPSEGLFAAGTFIHWFIEYEIKPLPPTPLQRIFLAVRPKEIEIPYTNE